MNYFFLRIVVGKTTEDIIEEEVALFINHLAGEHGTLDEELLNAIKKEMIDGEYFKGVPIEKVKNMIDETVKRLTGSKMSAVTRFYVNLLIENQRIGA